MDDDAKPSEEASNAQEKPPEPPEEKELAADEPAADNQPSDANRNEKAEEEKEEEKVNGLPESRTPRETPRDSPSSSISSTPAPSPLLLKRRSFVPVSESDLQRYVKKMLKTRVFLGVYQEIRLVELLNDYRSVILIDLDERALIRDLREVRKRLALFYGNRRIWFGFTDARLPPAIPFSMPCLWTSELHKLPLGAYWFQIRTVSFFAQEIVIQVRSLRRVEDVKVEELKQLAVRGARGEEDGQFEMPDWTELVARWRQWAIDAFTSLKDVKISVKSLVGVARAALILLLTVVAAAAVAMQGLSDFFVKLLETLAKLIKAFTPLLLGVIDMFSKLIGGFYILIAMIWRDSRGGPMPPPRPPQPRRPVQGTPLQAITPGPMGAYRRPGAPIGRPSAGTPLSALR